MGDLLASSRKSVFPDLIRDPASSFYTAEKSGIPDQVREDAVSANYASERSRYNG